MDAEMARKLAASFPPDKVKQKQGQGRRTMSYISHGLITERLNDVDPEWSWRPIQTYTYVAGDGRIHCEGVEVELTIGGVSRVEAGGPQRQDGFANEIKNAYSDALKRAAMRFGVALSMWETLVDTEGDEDYDDSHAPPARPAPRPLPQPAPTPRTASQAAPVANGSEAPAASEPKIAPSDDTLLNIIRNDMRDPDKRKKALHAYYDRATIVMQLNQRVEAVKDSGIPEADLKAAYNHHYERLTKVLAPAGHAG